MAQSVGLGAPVAHPSGALTLRLPVGWALDVGVPGAVLVAVDPVADFGFAPNLVVTRDHLDFEGLIDAMVDQQVESLDHGLTRPYLIDADDDEVDGQPARRVLLHHFADAGAVTLEQWMVCVAHSVWFFSCTVASLQYHDLAEAFRQIIATVQFDGEDAS